MTNLEVPDEKVPVSDVVCSFERDYIEELVIDVLKNRPNISNGARSSLNAAIDAAVRLDGFRNASRAAPDLLTPCILEEIGGGNDRIAASFLRAWSDTRGPLRKLVATHLREISVSADGLENRAHEFHLSWTRDEWLLEIDAVIESNPDLSPNEVGLMLCYVSGGAVLQGLDDTSVDSELLAGWLDQLRELPIESEDWADIEDFAHIALAIAAKKRTQIVIDRLRAFLEVLAELQQNFERELRYLEVDMDADKRTLEVAESATLPSHSSSLLEELRERLSEYSAVFPRADSRTEETQRAAERQRCEEAVLDVIARWDGYAAEKHELEDEEDLEGDPGGGQDGASEAVDAVPSAEHEALRCEVDALTREVESLRAENAGLVQLSDGLKADKKALDELKDKLSEDLEESRRTEENWRRVYIAERVAIADGEDESPAHPKTVKEAVTLAEKTFPDKLVFALNSKSDRRSPFQRPEEVFDALAWLATVYCETRKRPGQPPGFDKLLKESCPGWSYKPKQTEVTKEQFEEWYTTTVDGQRYELDPHIGKGTSFDRQRTMRIAFAWDSAAERVVVGFIGLHQRTRRS